MLLSAELFLQPHTKVIFTSISSDLLFLMIDIITHLLSFTILEEMQIIYRGAGKVAQQLGALDVLFF